MRVRKAISCLLVIAILASMSTAFAATDSRGTTPVKLETEALDFSVTVPTSLPVSIAADGEVTVATDAKIVNNSAGSIEVKNVAVEAVTPWELTTWSDTDNLSTEKVNSKKFALSLQGTGVQLDGSCSAKFNSIVANGNLGLTYNAHISPQSNALTGQQISNIVFTLGWDKATNNFAENEISSLSLDKGSLVMYVGTSETIHATAETKAQVAQLFSMRAAEDNGVTWSVDNENVSVENGKVTANSLGVSTVTASYEGLDAVCRVNVINAPVPLEAIGFTKNKVTLFKGESETVLLTYNPDKFTGSADVSLVSNNDNVNVVPANLAGVTGVTGTDGATRVTLTGNTGGTSVVTATVVIDGKTLMAKIEVEVISPYVNFIVTKDNRDWVGYTGEDNENLNIPEFFERDGITYKVSGIEDLAFVTCNNLNSVTIPKSVTYIGGAAFYYCENLTSVILNEGLLTIGDASFFSCFNLVDITIPNSVIDIGAHAFDACTCLISVNIPGNITNIKEETFASCSNLTNVTISSSVESIGSSAFSYCTGLTNIVIPESVTSIGDRAFENCHNLISVTIPEGVTSIGDSAFAYCKSLASVVIPNSIKHIGSYVFRSCKNLSKVTIYEGASGFDGFCFEECDKLQTAGPIGGGYNIEFGWTEFIPKNAFHYSKLVSVVIPNSITDIEQGAFSLSYLENVIIPDSVINIGKGAFYRCGVNAIISNNVTNIGEDAFLNASHITYYGNAAGAPWGALSMN